jgi:hypothetical protein
VRPQPARSRSGPMGRPGRYQASSPPVSWKVPVGPSLPIVAMRTMTSAPSATGCPPPTAAVRSVAVKPRSTAGHFPMARPGLEPGTPRFSGTPRSAGKSQESPGNQGVASRGCCAAIPVVSGGSGRVKDVAGRPRPFHGGCSRTRALSAKGPPSLRTQRGPGTRDPTSPQRGSSCRPCLLSATFTPEIALLHPAAVGAKHHAFGGTQPPNTRSSSIATAIET